MPICPTCRAAIPAESRFCPSCGGACVSPADAPTTAGGALTTAGGVLVTSATVDAATRSVDEDIPPTPAPAAAGSGAARDFVPGAMVAGRYRIVGLLGRGGMGEVYRADDLKLGQPVALKFLPAGLDHDAGRLQRFLGEVRTARQVTHANVCRVFDIGDVEGRHFLSMEYVDGEDLASLLRRVGRLPQERAVEVARQICAGLAAAHDRGILHRDLKPANVMIDGRGQVRLTDFGLAGLAAEIAPHDVTSGTPDYMAPEQLAGREVTARSDIYALGLVLYELFTGRKVYQASTLAELRDLHDHSRPSSLTSHVQDLDPAVERAVMRCLEKDPARRPVSALAVSAALPGGDPLAAALAAGETPSPELLAGVGEREGLRPGRVALLALAALALVVGMTRWAGTMSLPHYLPLDKRPEVLMDRAEDVLATLGFIEPVYAEPADRAWGMLVWNSVIAEVGDADSTAARWDGLRDRPDAASFWYRQSPRLLLPDPSGGQPVFERGAVQLTNPTAEVPGEVSIVLDLAGNLQRLEVMPKRFSTREPAEPDWAPLFALADLDTARFRPDRPRYQRFMSPDVRRAWVGTRADRPDVELRVEAGAFEGRPVLFNVATTGIMDSLDEDPTPTSPTTSQWLTGAVQPLMILFVMALMVRLASANLGQGRSDSRGAVRFALAFFVLYTASSALGSHALSTWAAADELWPILAGACFIAVVAWGTYSAAEPLGRRVWPTMFVSLSRLLARSRVSWRDPLIGQSVLVGVIAGALVFTVRVPLRWLATSLLEGRPPGPFGYDLSLLAGQRQALGLVLEQWLQLVFVLVMVATLVVIRYLVKRRLPTLALTLAAWLLIKGQVEPAVLPFMAPAAILLLAVLLRWGVVAFGVAEITMALCWQARSADWSAWYSEGALLALGALILLTIYGAWAATGGRARSA